MSALLLIAGHGGADPGAVAGGEIERELNIETVLAANDYLSRAYVPIGRVETVIYPASDGRGGDELLAEKIAKANAAAPDALVLEVHHNMNAAGYGAQVWYSARAGATKSDRTHRWAPYFLLALGLIVESPVPLIASDRSRFGKLGILDDHQATGLLLEVRNVGGAFRPDSYRAGALIGEAVARCLEYPRPVML